MPYDDLTPSITSSNTTHLVDQSCFPAPYCSQFNDSSFHCDSNQAEITQNHNLSQLYPTPLSNDTPSDNLLPPSDLSTCTISSPDTPSHQISSKSLSSTIPEMSSFINNLHSCLAQENDDVTKRMLHELKSSLICCPNLPIDMNSGVATLLYSSDKWPKVDSKACFVEGCDFKASTEGLLRVHLCNAHMFDSGRARDELINIVSYLSNKTITTIYDKCDGFSKTPEKHMIFCHFPNCGYATERDFRVKKHRERHRRFNEHINNLGRFWGVLKSWIEVTNNFPSIGTFLGEGEMWSCNLCDFISSTSQNVRDHIGCTHKNLNEIEKNDSLIPIHLKFVFDENPLICMNDEPRQNNLDLFNDLTRDEITEACDIAYTNSMKENDADIPTMVHQIDPHKIVSRHSGQENSITQNINDIDAINENCLLSKPQSHSNCAEDDFTDASSDFELPLPNTLYLSGAGVNPNHHSISDTLIANYTDNSNNNGVNKSDDSDFLIEDDHLSGEEDVNHQLIRNSSASPLTSSESDDDDVPSRTDYNLHHLSNIMPHHSIDNDEQSIIQSECSHSQTDSHDDICSSFFPLQNESKEPFQEQYTQDQYSYKSTRKRSSKFNGSRRAADSNTPITTVSLNSPLDNNLLNNANSDTDKRIIQGMKWYQQAQTRGTVRLPKLDRSNRKLIAEGIKELFEDELIPLINDYNPDTLHEIDEDIKWKVFEGAYEEVIHRIRIHIATKLNVDPSKIYIKSHKKKWFNNINEELITTQLHTKLLSTLKSNIEKLNNNDIDNDDTSTDILRSRVANSLHLIGPELRMQLFSTENICTIVNDLSNVEHAEKCGEWLEMKINECIKHEMGIKSASRHASKIQECYSDNPKKTLNNFILNEAKPNCPINEDILYNFFTHSFQKGNFQFHPDDAQGIFKLTNCFSDEDREEFMNKLCDAEAIKDVISSRKFNSAAGPDGIDYSIFKIAINEATTLVKSIMKIIISFKRVPKAWKDSNMSLIYKKGDLNSPANWRPISISNAIYRIFSCVFAKTINLFNSHLHIYSSNQKGFLEKINGCSDNSSIISELYYDAMRNHKSLYITALDLQNAFGSVDHEMIVQCLKERGFPEDFCMIIKDIYQGSTTKIITQQFTSKKINVKKGTKQGCPVSPLLFNLCLEPLFKAINSLNSEDGYSVTWNNKSVSFNALAYADDLLIISESLNGMNNILKVCYWFFKYSNLGLWETVSLTT